MPPVPPGLGALCLYRFFHEGVIMPRRPDIHCAGCGSFIWRGRGGLPEGQATCLDCRRGRVVHGTRQGYRDRKCRCGECVVWQRQEARAYRARRRAEGRPIKSFGSSGPWISESVKLAVFERDGWTCQLCGEPLDRSAGPNDDWFPSLDHVTPQSVGGAHTVDNLRAAHRWCNSIRGAADYHAELRMAGTR